VVFTAVIQALGQISFFVLTTGCVRSLMSPKQFSFLLLGLTSIVTNHVVVNASFHENNKKIC